jgi:hypothetical protein
LRSRHVDFKQVSTLSGAATTAPATTQNGRGSRPASELWRNEEMSRMSVRKLGSHPKTAICGGMLI